MVIATGRDVHTYFEAANGAPTYHRYHDGGDAGAIYMLKVTIL